MDLAVKNLEPDNSSQLTLVNDGDVIIDVFAHIGKITEMCSESKGAVKYSVSRKLYQAHKALFDMVVDAYNGELVLITA
jgi:hypothetical protein